MANGTEKKDVMVGKVRSGMKREFEFAFKALSEVSGFLGRTRSNRVDNGSIGSVEQNKRFNRSGFEEDKKESDLEAVRKVDLKNDKEDEVKLVESGDVFMAERGNDNVGVVEVVDSVKGDDREGQNGVQRGIVQALAASDRSKLQRKGSGGLGLVLVNGSHETDDGKGFEHKHCLEGDLGNSEEKPARRFTRSASSLKEKMVEKSPAEHNGNGFKGVVVVQALAARDHSKLRGERRTGLELVLANGIKLTEAENQHVNANKEDNNYCMGDSNNLVDTPTRRFTRSALKSKEEIVGNSPPKVVSEEQNGVGILSGAEVKAHDTRRLVNFEDNTSLLQEPEMVEKIDCQIKRDDGSLQPSKENTGEKDANGSLPVLASCSDSKVEVKPMRRFTRSLLKPKSETVEKSPLKVGLEEQTEKSNEVRDCDMGNSSPAAVVTSSGMALKSNGLRKFPKSLKDLFASGILEGQNVKYVSGSKTRLLGASGLCGVVKGSGILCSCDDCEGKEVVTPAMFELHAGSSNKRPPEYVYLDNGKTLRDVLNACKNASLERLNEVIQLCIGSFPTQKANFCLNCRGEITEDDSRASDIFCASCVKLKDSQATLAGTEGKTEGIQKSHSVKTTPGGELKCSSTQGRSRGKVTRKDLRLHKLVFEEDVLPDGTELGYYVQGQKLLEGYKKGSGIFCFCCDSVVSASQFEAHAGWATRRKPYLNIYTSNGVSLHELSVSLCKARKFATHENDDLCQICGDGGELVCCDGCPRSYHKECIPLSEVPQDTWYCKTCMNTYQKEKFAEHNANAIAAGRIAGVDAIEQITKRCIRIVKTLETEIGGCSFCRELDFSKEFGPRSVIICDQCEREFHVGCLKEHNVQDLKELPEGKWFCCKDCERINLALQKLVAQGAEKIPDSCLTVVKKSSDKTLENSGRMNIRWQLLSGNKDCPLDLTALLSEVVAIFHEQFDPIYVAGSELIPCMVYGKNIKEHEFGGMYSAVLLADDVIVSAAIFRVFGSEVAELPLVATSKKSQGQGYFQVLFSCLEKLLGRLNIKNLILPAAEEAESIWTKKFGFHKIPKEEWNDYRQKFQMMVFEGTPVLQKSIPKIRQATFPTVQT